MVKKLFSKTLEPFEGTLENPALLDSIRMMGEYLGVKKIPVLKWSENFIAIPLKIKVELPSFPDIDIRPQENILVVIHQKYYPSITPSVYTDRLDFPKNKLAHLYIAKNERPPAFCLVKGNFNEWYSNKNLKDLLIRTKNWLSDAASNQLTTNGDQFDPLRLEGYSGDITYKYDDFADIVNAKKEIIESSNFTLAVFDNVTKSSVPSFTLHKIISQVNAANVVKEYNAAINLIKDDKPNAPCYYMGYLLWSSADDTFDEYDPVLPTTWKELKKYCEQYNISTDTVETFICEFDFDYFVAVPLIIGIRRSKNIIGFSSNIEFINFYLNIQSNDKEGKKIKDTVEVKFQSHKEPLSVLKANKISGSNYNLGSALIVGCGALGSKIIMHMIRNGFVEFSLADPDTLSPHNMVRHSLGAEHTGKNKSAALIDEMKKIYKHDNLKGQILFEGNAEILLSGKAAELYNLSQWIFDFTASTSFFNAIVNTTEITKPKIIRSLISDFGNKGISYYEGEGRNPRLDDLQYYLYYKSLSENVISEWLKREHEVSEKDKELISVGVGCNSETTILSDETISLHAAYHATIIKKVSNKQRMKTGQVYISDIDHSNDEFKLVNYKYEVEPLVVVKSANGTGWQIRMLNGIIERMKSEMGKAMPHETGGIFIGSINHKTKTIHVLDLIDAPSDSSATPVCFFRGVSGLPEKIDEINQLSGGQLGYVGEWHSHPYGPNTLSGTDLKTVKKFKSEFQTLTTPLPVFISIITPEYFLPYVF